MACGLCGNKPSWCECSPADYLAAEQEDQIYAINERLESLEYAVISLTAWLVNSMVLGEADFESIKEILDHEKCNSGEVKD